MIRRSVSALTSAGSSTIEPRAMLMSVPFVPSAARTPASTRFFVASPPGQATTRKSDAAASDLTFDKWRTRRSVSAAGVQVAPGCSFPSTEKPTAAALGRDFGDQIVLKPNRQGSSVGLQIVSSSAETTYGFGYANPFKFVTVANDAQQHLPLTAVNETGSDIRGRLLAVDQPRVAAPWPPAPSNTPGRTLADLPRT